MMNFEDLKKSGPFTVMNLNSDVFVTRPRVDFNTVYQNFLKTNGAYDQTP